MYRLCYEYNLISNIGMFILDGYMAIIIKPMLSKALYSLGGAWEETAL